MNRPRFRSIPWSFWLAFLALLLPACRTLETASPAQVVQAAVPEEFYPQWTPFARDLTPGLDCLAGRIGKPRLEFWALRVDLREPGLQIVVNGGAPTGEEPWALPPGHIPSTKVSAFVKRYGCLAGINTNPFSPVSGKEGEDRFIDGLTMAEGVMAALPNPRFAALVFYEDRRAAILSQADLDAEDLGTIRNAVGGFHIVLRQGVLPPRLGRPGGKIAPRHPRSAAGLSEDGAILYLLAVDGRRPGSVGATEAELGIILKQLGACWGLNFDGGGSTALVLRVSPGTIKTVNTPIHGYIPGRERAVATCLGIALQ